MYDIIVIGGGPGGYAAAIRASQLGGKVVLVESKDIGGTCVNRGCIPSKVWLQSASILRTLQKGAEFGIHASAGPVDFSTIVARKNGVANDIKMGMESLLGNNGVDVVTGTASIKTPGSVDVEGRVLEGKKIILATGSSLDDPDIPGLKDAVMTTDQALDLTKMPTSVLIWGTAGSIEVEMAALLNAFGAKVYLTCEGPRILPDEDHDTSQRVSQALRAQGVELLPRLTLESVKKTKIGFECRMSGTKAQNVEVEKVLVSARKPNTDDLGLEGAGIKLKEDGGIDVNQYLETAVKGIFAIGDATGGWMLSHMASSMAVFAAENAMGRKNAFPSHLIPRGLWTFPQVGAVGLSEEEAEQQGYDVETGSVPYAINGLGMALDEVDGAVKIVSDAEYGEILGVHIVGANATELIGEAGLAMQLECTANELANGIRVHPTFSEAVVDAARDAMSWALYLPRRR